MPASLLSLPPSSASMSPPSSSCSSEWPALRAQSSLPARRKARGHASLLSFPSAFSSSLCSFWERPSSSLWALRPSSELTAPTGPKLTSSQIFTQQVTKLTPSSANKNVPAKLKTPSQNFMKFWVTLTLAFGPTGLSVSLEIALMWNQVQRISTCWQLWRTSLAAVGGVLSRTLLSTTRLDLKMEPISTGSKT